MKTLTKTLSLTFLFTYALTGVIRGQTVAPATPDSEFRPEQSLITTSAPMAATPASRVELFNGKDFAGWTFFMRTNADPMQTWSIENGLIRCTGKPNGYMRTVENYRDYKVTVEWRFLKPGNTGVTVHMQEPDKVWPATIECQGAHNQQGDFWMQGGATCKDHTTPQTRRVKMTGPSNENPLGEWNTFTVECEGATVRIFVNGKLMNEVTECSVTSGHIGLQSEGAELEIRKVFLEPLTR